MRTHLIRGALLLPAALALVTAGACSDAEPGAAAPATSAPADGGESVPNTAPSSPGDAAAPTASLDPCTLLEAGELAEFATFKTGEQKDIASARACVWLPEREGGESLPTIGLNVRDSQGIDSVNDTGQGTTAGELEGSGRKAVQAPTTGGCTLALAVGETSRVDVQVSGVDTDQACDIAGKVADVVDPRLPEG
ncbi:DUF3558 family protein [Qaidamihabitans albus]|uniref:DUF3558 family protein n=1 Tax=Qaidamihabitans albus TaxID=2795733 RepID=UPI0018F18CCE|nr:DUF3558 family protein [Qaidamihabitans albus]